MKKIKDSLKKEIFFVIPAYNESKVIADVISKLNDKGFFNLIIIDDGSKDNTFNIVNKIKSNGLVLLEHIINRGQGAALKTGIDYCLMKKNCKYIVTFDSDGQHRISDLINFIEPLERNICDIAIGSRFLKKESRDLVPLKKKILLRGALVITYILSRIWLSDTHNGYRVMNIKAAKKIKITMDGFEHASEIIDEIARKKIKYLEVPVFIDYTDYSKAKGQSMFNSINIFLKMFFK